MAHLRGTLEHFAQAMFGDEAKIRLRPNYFPFTEPSAEMDCLAPERQGRRALDRVGRLRHGQPQRAARRRHRPRGVPGLRLRHGHRAHACMFRNDMKDMRDMVEGDIRFSQQFGMVV